MVEVINSYETIFIIDPTLSEEDTGALTEKFRAMIEEAGSIDEVDVWGTRRLAYPINDLNEGYYVLINFKAKPGFIAELERVYGITDGILRNIVIRK